MREKEIEKKLIQAVKQAGGICPKLVSPGFDGMPDRMVPVSYTHLSARNGMLFITLPSGRSLAYVKPKIGTNKFGGDCIT